MIHTFPWFLVIIPTIIITMNFQPPTEGASVVPIVLRPLIALDTLFFYLSKLFLPFHLCFDYGRTPELVTGNWWGYITWIFPVIITLFFFVYKRGSLFFACYLIFIAGFFPVSGIIPFDFQKISTVADRYLYFSMLGPSIATALIIEKFGRKLLYSFIPILIFMGFLAHQQVKIWHSAFSLYTHNLKINSRSHISLNNMALRYLKDPEKKISYFLSAIDIDPGDRATLVNIADLLARLKFQQPEFNFDQFILKERISEGEKYFKQGTALVRRGNIHKAYFYYGKSFRINMLHLPTCNNLGLLFLIEGYITRAKILFGLALAIAPENSSSLNNMGVTLFSLGKKEKAYEYFQRALVQSPGNHTIQNNLDKISLKRTKYEKDKGLKLELLFM